MSELTSPVIEFSDVSFKYNEKKIFKEFSFALGANEKVGIDGANGSGKTTLLKLVVGLLRLNSGIINVYGKKICNEDDFKKVRRRAGFLFQDSDNQLFSPTVIEDVCFGLLNIGYSEDKSIELANKALSDLKIEHLANKITYKLSGGEKRLSAFATIYAMNPDFYLLDEPAAGLDYETEEMLAEFIANLNKPMLIVSHNKDFIKKTVNRVVVL